MKKFSDFEINIQDDKAIFDVQKISITDILNCEIEVIAFETGIKTQHGVDRYVVKIRQNDTEYKFFTNSGRIKQTLDQVPKDGFPFTTTIKQQRYGSGSGRMYYFT